MNTTYHILRVQITRTDDTGRVTETFSFITDEDTADLKAYKKTMCERYKVNRVALIYEQRP